MIARHGTALLDDVQEEPEPSKLRGEILVAGVPDHRPLFSVQGFTLSDAANLLINFLDQASNEEVRALLAEAKSRTATNCWCMAYDIAPAVAKFCRSTLEDRGLQS